MIKKIRCLLFVVFSLGAFYGQAGIYGGDELGNGGDVIICDAGGFRTYDVLDIFEGQTFYGFSYQRSESVNLAAEAVFSALRKFDPSRACLYSYWMTTYAQERTLINYGLPDIPDEGPLYLLEGCRIEQVVIRQDAPQFRQDRYFVNINLLNRLSHMQKVALALHEFVYREGRAVSLKVFKNSLRARRFTSFVMSDQMQNATPEEYRRELRSSGLPEGENYCDSNHPIYSM